MAMNDMLAVTSGLTLAGAAGGLLGLLFFGGLWWTLRRAFASPRPGLWVAGSLLLRMACVAGGFVVVAGGDWRRLLSCLFGFWAARWLVVHMTDHPATPTPGRSLAATPHPPAAKPLTDPS